MLFWLTFLASLPTINTSKTDSITACIETTPVSMTAQMSPLTSRVNPAVLGQVETTPAYMTAQMLPSTSRVNPPVVGQLGGGLTIFAGFFAGVIFLVLFAGAVYSRLYQVTPANEAFVKTGGVLRKRRTVIKHGGS